ncbi:transposase [Synechococcus sp. CBW1107]|uniref:transposase n=2 Tax=unclassified Synechococcus TaxID=2626047 RepID=UPI002AD27B26|nr:transposase [Synechococcus sp. CBW1107]CAK6701832.1 hypothetical protein IFHNHDMJ_03240 [Synechococcus sp. CBW1107]
MVRRGELDAAVAATVAVATEARGLRRFLLRDLKKVDGEGHLIAATHNLLKLFRFRRSQQLALASTTG